MSFTLGAFVENLTLTSAADLDGTGNELANKIFGNSGANSLVGLGGNDRLDGGAGADVMAGGMGNDIYYVDAAGDVVSEADGQGTDGVWASVSFTLGAFVEYLRLASAADLDGTGNDLANKIFGNSGANRLNGGAGSDMLTGMGGNDVFVFTNAPGIGHTDRITDMNEMGDDTIALDNAIFVALGAAGALDVGAFVSNTTGLAQDLSDRIIFEQDTGELYYDANGSAAGGTYTLIALLDAGIALTATDILVI